MDITWALVRNLAVVTASLSLTYNSHQVLRFLPATCQAKSFPIPLQPPWPSAAALTALQPRALKHDRFALPQLSILQ